MVSSTIVNFFKRGITPSRLTDTFTESSSSTSSTISTSSSNKKDSNCKEKLCNQETIINIILVVLIIILLCFLLTDSSKDMTIGGLNSRVTKQNLILLEV